MKRQTRAPTFWVSDSACSSTSIRSDERIGFDLPARLALLDRDDPTAALLRRNEWIMGPHAHYESQGDVPDVVFPCGWILRDDGDTVDRYYGAADLAMVTGPVRVFSRRRRRGGT